MALWAHFITTTSCMALLESKLSSNKKKKKKKLALMTMSKAAWLRYNGYYMMIKKKTFNYQATNKCNICVYVNNCCHQVNNWSPLVKQEKAGMFSNEKVVHARIKTLHKTPESTATPTQGIKTFIWQQGTRETGSNIHWSASEDLQSAWGKINTAVKQEVNLQKLLKLLPRFCSINIAFHFQNKPCNTAVLLKV